MTRLPTLARFEVSGEILSEDTIALLTAEQCKIPGADIDEGALRSAYDLLLERWQAIRTEVASYSTERLRERWQIDVLELLDFKPEYLRSHTTFGKGRKIPLTHRSGDIPIWLLNYAEDFDAKPEKDSGIRKSPHELFQEYLDQTTDDEWGILFNGKCIRLLHDYHKTLTRSYVEADLESIFDSLDIDAFRAVWRIFHASRFVKDKDGKKPIERLRDHSRQEGAVIGRELEDQVRRAIETLANGFLAADREGRILRALREEHGAIDQFYQALLRIIYRILFLLFIENRPNWTPAHDPIWADSYSVTRLREMAEASDYSRAGGEDLWEGIKVVSRIIREGSEHFDIHPYGGELFDDKRLWLLADAPLANADLLHVIRLLTMFERNKQVYRVNFRTLDIEALGSVYEGLLGSRPVLTPDGRFDFTESTQRKQTGTYYTPKELVALLIDSALVPVIEERLKDKTTKKEQEEALLSIKVVDPACGSGAFLVQAMDKLAEKLVEIRLEGEEPSDLDIREARRDVVHHCIHGVDLNPLAVDLCRFVLWINVAHPRFPLSYLEPLIKCGNSLIGVPLPNQAKDKGSNEEGWPNSIPDEAFNPMTGDDKSAAASAKRRNREERAGQYTFETPQESIPKMLTHCYAQLREVDDKTTAGVRHAELLYRNYLLSEEYTRYRLAADLWCSAFFWKHERDQQYLPTHQWLRLASTHPERIPEEFKKQIEEIAEETRFFHWHLEFPDVFDRGGFDCVIGNPPWETLQLNEEEFFAQRDPEIAALPGARRKAAIEKLRGWNPLLWQEYLSAKKRQEATTNFFKFGGRFALTTQGKLNTYALFAELFRTLLAPRGRAGVICPTGIATDNTTSEFIGDVMSRKSLVSLYDFENRDALFPGVHRSYKFCTLTVSGSAQAAGDFAFFLTNPSQLQDATRRFTLSAEDIALLNPNTRTCPVFRTKQDAELTVDVYRRVPVLVNEKTGQNAWGVRFRQGLFNMTSDSHLFKTQPGPGLLPLYEAKMIWQFDHRFGTYEGVTDRNSTHLPTPTPEQYADPAFTVKPWYWVHGNEVNERLKDWHRRWLIGFRDITNATNERTVISCVFLRVAASGIHLLITPTRPIQIASLLGNLNSLTLDYVARMKVGGTHVAFFYSKQLAILPPQAYTPEHTRFLLPRILELVYTAWDMKPFADDVWKESDDTLRQAVTNQWQENKTATGGNDWNPPDWAEIDPNGIPLAPFRWDEDRRANIRAELDAYYARLYGLNRKQLRYILDPHGLSWKELEDILDPREDPTCSGPHLMPEEPALDFPGETFRVLKEKEENRFGEYRTRRLVLDAWARLEAELGPAKPVNYHEMLKTERTQEPILDTNDEPAEPHVPVDIELRPPGSDESAVKPQNRKGTNNSRQYKRPAQKRPGMPDVIVNGRPARLIKEEQREGYLYVEVVFDGERESKIFRVPPADFRRVH